MAVVVKWIQGADQNRPFFQMNRDIGFQINRTNYKNVRDIIVTKKRSTDPDFLMFIVKADTCSTFGNSIDLLDEMSICNIPDGHYAEMDITDEERKQINDNH